MRRSPSCYGRGFSLVELMVTVLIVGIVAAVAYPSYVQTVRKTRRADARAALTTLAQRLERCYTQYGAYNDAGCVIASPQNSPEDHYQITVARTATTFTLTATPIGSQAKDTRCTTLVLDHLGDKTATGSATEECW